MLIEKATEFIVIMLLMGAGLKIRRALTLPEDTRLLRTGDGFIAQGALWSTVGLIVLGSILIHGVTVTPVMRHLNRRFGRSAD